MSRRAGNQVRGVALTQRQQAVLSAIRRHVRLRGVPPSRSELARELEVRQQSTVDQQLNALQKKGWVRLHPGVERGIQLLREGAPLLDPEQLPEVTPATPIVAEERPPPRLDTYDSIVERFEAKPDYFLRVTGDSLDKVGLYTGDVVAVRRTPEASHGDVVVARIGPEITLRRYCRNTESTVELQPESTNPAHEPIRIDPRTDDFEIVGVIVGAIVGARRRNDCAPA